MERQSRLDGELAIATALPKVTSEAAIGKVAIAYRLGVTGGRVLYSRDVPKNQQAASRAYRGLALAAKKERLCAELGGGGGGSASSSRAVVDI